MTPIDPAKLSKTQRPTSGVATPVHRAEAVRPLQHAERESGAAATFGLIGPTAGADAPFDTDRVAEIRKAVEQGRYPIVPTRIADAMIAAGFLLRTPE